MRLRRYRNIVEEAANYLREYCHASSMEAMLRVNKDSFKNIYAVALLFRHIIVQFVEMSNYEAGVISDANEVKCGEYIIVTFMPGKIARANNLTTKCLRIREK